MPHDGGLIAVLSLLSLLSVTTIATAKPPSPAGQNNLANPNDTAFPKDSAHTDDSIPITAEALRDSIGRKSGQQGFNPQADLNSDGVVNALDVALFKRARREGRWPFRTTSAVQTVAGTERIIVEMPTTTAFPGQTVSVLFLLRDNTTPLSSYTVDVDIVPEPGAVGTVAANVGLTNFFDQQNFITACPVATCPTGPIRDPLFSVIADNGNGGVSVTTNTDDFSTVLAADDVNDVLAQMSFDVPLDALGDFTIQLNPSSTLTDGIGASVTFASTPGTIRVLNPASIPTVSQWGMIVMSVSTVVSGCVVLAKRSSAMGLASGG